MKTVWKLTLLTLLIFSLTGCSSPLFAPSTSTPTLTATATATATVTPSPTSTSTPTQTATLEPTVTIAPTSTKPPQSGGICPISTDDTYGYTLENPIRVGGDFFSGPSRERAYLDNLRGPNGEKFTYERHGSTHGIDTILDIYELYGLPTKVILYVDMYKYEQLMAPVGLTCAGPFISAP
ncbi:MAG: hypothetical protein ACOYZ6_06045 [Chloroflexota bacterium]